MLNEENYKTIIKTHTDKKFITLTHHKQTQVSLTRFLQSEVKIIHIIVQDQDGQNNNILAEAF
jgi:hypothetical protein